MNKHPGPHTFLREPLLHFLLIGAALFIIFSLSNDSTTEKDNSIIITQSDLENLASAWLKRAGRPPTEQEREQQLKRYIREQVLYREAVAMGLDKNDAIVRKRLAKKIEYLFDDLSYIPEPTEEELKDYLQKHAATFTRPASISFSHIFFDPNQRGQKTGTDAEEVLAQLKTDTKKIDTINLGDRSLLPYTFANEREQQLTSLFGEAFSEQVLTLPIDGWQGPITSSYGLHLVYIETRIEAQLPPLAEIRQRVAKEWRSEKQKAANELFYQSLYQRYEVVIDNEVKNDAMASKAQ